MPGIELQSVSIRFKNSYDRVYRLADAVQAITGRIRGRKRPTYYWALRDLSLRVGSGDVLGVIGANGSGKSTLLRVMAGIYHPDEGCVTRRGKISTLLALGTGFNNALSGRDNIKLNGLILGMNRQQIDERMPEIIAFADIGDHIDRPMKYYSTGMFSRLSFAITTAMRPDVLLLDEIFSVGDLSFQKKSTEAMEVLRSRSSCQVIVSHNTDLLRNICNRVIWIRGGTVAAEGEPEAVIGEYKAFAERAAARG